MNCSPFRWSLGCSFGMILCGWTLLLPTASAFGWHCKQHGRCGAAVQQKIEAAKSYASAARLVAVQSDIDEAETAPSAPVGKAELSVGPFDELRYPADRPAWIDAGPELDEKIHRWPVSSPPSSTAELSRRALAIQLRAAAETYLETLFDSPEAPQVIPLEDDWIAERQADDHYYEGEVYSGGEVLYEAAAELRFTAKDRRWLQAQWDSHLVSRRMVGLGAATAGGTVLLLMATAGLSLVARRLERRAGAGQAATTAV